MANVASIIPAHRHFYFLVAPHVFIKLFSLTNAFLPATEHLGHLCLFLVHGLLPAQYFAIQLPR